MRRFGQKLSALGIPLVVTMVVTTTTVLGNDYSGHWAEPAIKQWMNNGIVSGYDAETFKPNQPITRAEFAAILSRVFNLSVTEGADTYVDLIINADKWYVNPINQVMALDLMYIEGNYFKPDQYITREEAAYAMAKAYALTNDTGSTVQFQDYTLLSTWAVDSVTALVEKQYLKGNPDGNFKPQGTLTRAELVTMLSSIVQAIYNKPGTYTQSTKGNVVINTAGVKLKDAVIEGDVYVTQGVGNGSVQLENVTVKGRVYINSGTIQMSGNYNTVQLATAMPVTLSSGSINTLEVEKLGAYMEVAQEASIGQLIQNQPVILEGEGYVGGQTIATLIPVQLQSAGIYINGQYEVLPIVDNKVVIDLGTITQNHSPQDILSGLSFKTNIQEGVLVSSWGRVKSDVMYSFPQAEEELGFIREMALEMGISPDLVVGYILGKQPLTLGDILNNYATAQKLAGSLDVTLKERYEFVRVMSYPGAKASLITIQMKLK